jgi:hypothetical protein
VDGSALKEAAAVSTGVQTGVSINMLVGFSQK